VRTLRRIVTSAAAIAAVSAAWAAAAGAGLSEVSTITLNVSGAPTFRGHVNSPDRFCHADRKVILYAFGEHGRYVFDTDRTNQKGKWQLSDQLDGAATFQATVTAQKAKGLLCEADSSGVKSANL
jgi:hypothetical protein